MSELSKIAAAMRQQAEAGQPARRQLPGGLLVKFGKSGDGWVLTLTRQRPGPGEREREQWRAAFGVDSRAMEYKASEGEYVVVSVEWVE